MAHGSLYFSVGDDELHYLEWGSGKRLLLAFHGYGNDAGIFSLFREYLTDYTILSFDLPYHGASRWADDRMLQKEDLLAMVTALMNQYGVEKVSLLGYSMGGRVCMTIVEKLPASIDKVLLIAADGLAVNKLYYFCTHTWLGKKLFRDVLERPEQYLGFIEWLKKIKLLDTTRYKFATQHLRSPESRLFLLQVWPAMRDLIPRPAALRRVIKQYQVPVSVFMGIYDRLMPPELAEKFKAGLDSVQVIIFEKGHRVFDATNARQIAAHLS